MPQPRPLPSPGAAALVPGAKRRAGWSIGAHFREPLRNIRFASSSMEKVLRVNVYLSDLAHYIKINSVNAGWRIEGIASP
jgi:hypothetical protein